MSEQSDDRTFTLSIVKVKIRQHGSTTAKDVSDSSVMDAGSRTKDKSFSQSTASSLVGNRVDKANETASSSGSNFKSRSTSNASTIAYVKFVLNNSCDDSSASSNTKNFRKEWYIGRVDRGSEGFFDQWKINPRIRKKI